MVSVLYIAKDPALLELARNILIRDCFPDVDCAESVPEAIGLLQKKKYDLIVSDPKVPGLYDTELIRVLLGINKDTPFILCTFRGMDEASPRELELSAAMQELFATGEELQEKIHELEDTRDELHESQSRLIAYINGSPIPQFVIDKNHHVILWNEALEKYSGIPASEILGTDTHWRAFYPESRPCMADLLVDGEVSLIPDWYKGKYTPSRLVEGAFEAIDFFPHMGTGGVWLNFTAAVIRNAEGEIIGAIETLEDISRQKNTEFLLRESEEQYRALFYENNSVALLIDPDTGNITDANAAASRFYGYSYATLTSLNLSSLNRLPEEKIRVDLSCAIHEPAKHFFSSHYLSSGEKRFVEIYSGPIPVKGRSLLYSIIHDITEERKAEIKLRENEARLYSIVQGCPVPQFVIDNNHRIIYWNHALEKCTLIPVSEVIGTDNHWRAFYDKKRPCLVDLLVDGAESEIPVLYNDKVTESRFVEWAYEGTDFFPELGENGTWLFFTAAPIQDDEGMMIGAIETLEDITEQKRASDALMQANNKLNLLSSITRHDVLNQLTALSGYLELSRGSSDVSKVQTYLLRAQEIASTIERQVTFTRDYQTIGINNPEWKRVSLLITEVAASLDTSTIQIRIDTGNLEIYADPLLYKVFYNLIENSMRHGITTKTISFSYEKQEGDLVLICTDDGEGIGAHEKELIFERGYGKNTGFGLFLIRQVLAITGIDVIENGEPGSGARFEMHIPKGVYRNA